MEVKPIPSVPSAAARAFAEGQSAIWPTVSVGMRRGDVFTIEGRYVRRKGWWPALLAFFGFYQASRGDRLQQFRVLDDVTSDTPYVRYD